MEIGVSRGVCMHNNVFDEKGLINFLRKKPQQQEDKLIKYSASSTEYALTREIKKRDFEKLVSELIEIFIQQYNAKTFVVNDSSLGLHCFNGKKYYECEEYALHWLHEKYSLFKLEDLNMRFTSMLKEFMLRLRATTYCELRYEPMTLSFNNTLFDWIEFLNNNTESSFKKHDPDTIVFHHIPHELNVEALKQYATSSSTSSSNIEEAASKLCPRSLETFKQWVGDKWPLLFEITGYTLYPRYDLHKAVMLVGDGANGKSTYLRLVKSIHGSENTTGISLQELCDTGNRFAVAELYRKLVNIYADIPSRPIFETGRFKILTGEDPISADRKFKGRIIFTNYCKLLFSANQLPPVYDMSTAYWRRWIVIEFPNKFAPNPEFFERTFTKEEIEGVIVVSLLAFREAWKKRRFSFEETEADYKEYWLRKTNTVYAFLKDRCEIRSDSRIETSQLYEAYVKYCNENDLEPVDKRIFTIELERLGIKKVKIHTTHYYKGVELKQREEPEQREPPDLWNSDLLH